MITTFLRSSSFGAHSLCELSFYLQYVLGLKSPSGKAAARGNVVHKALETLAWQSYHRARGNRSYLDETFGELEVEAITPEWTIDAAYAHYKREEAHLKWKDYGTERYPGDLEICRDLTHRALTLSNGYFDPRNRKIIEPEKRFDITIEKPWAHFAFDTPDGPIEGQLGLKGTVDMLIEDDRDPSIIEVCDWKTGKRRDWAIDDEVKAVKDYDKLMRDPQLLIYYYALSHLLPDATLVFTIVYIADGGPFRLYFGPEHIQIAEDMIREKFESIKASQKPYARKSKACFTFCHFGKTPSEHDPTLTKCEFFKKELEEKGMDLVTIEHGKPGAYNSYQDGGGRKSSD